MTDREQHIESLLNLGSGKSRAEIQELLEKHNWNPDAAAGALFDTSASTSEPAGWDANANTESGWSGGTWDDGKDGYHNDWSKPFGGEPSRGRSMDRGKNSTVGALNHDGLDSQKREP
jgi:hypothetical protein